MWIGRQALDRLVLESSAFYFQTDGSTGNALGTTLPIPKNVFGVGFGKITNRDLWPALIDDVVADGEPQARFLLRLALL